MTGCVVINTSFIHFLGYIKAGAKKIPLALDDTVSLKSGIFPSIWETAIKFYFYYFNKNSKILPPVATGIKEPF